MEKVKISISGHDFYLKSEDPNRMYETAENLQKRIDKLCDGGVNVTYRYCNACGARYSR